MLNSISETWPSDPLPPLSYDVIVADPPWDFENYSAAGTKKGADPHYAVMPLGEIESLPVHVLASQEVARAWGFKPLSEIVWRKLTATGKARMGTGYESAILASRSGASVPARNKRWLLLWCATATFLLPRFRLVS